MFVSDLYHDTPLGVECAWPRLTLDSLTDADVAAGDLPIALLHGHKDESDQVVVLGLGADGDTAQSLTPTSL